jgi:predicted RNA-binding protein YlxR (DUF448 family)
MRQIFRMCALTRTPYPTKLMIRIYFDKTTNKLEISKGDTRFRNSRGVYLCMNIENFDLVFDRKIIERNLKFNSRTITDIEKKVMQDKYNDLKLL